jgi:hypothetical protein
MFHGYDFDATMLRIGSWMDGDINLPGPPELVAVARDASRFEAV